VIVYSCIIAMLLTTAVILPNTAQSAWQVSPSFRLSESVDTNPLLGTTQESDIVTKLGTNLAAHYIGENVGLIGSYDVQLQMFAQHSKENGFLQDGSFDVDLNRWVQKHFRTSEVTVKEDFSFTPELQDFYFDDKRQQVGSLSSYGIRSQKTDSFRNALSLNLTNPVSDRWSFVGRYSNLYTTYKRSALSDNITHAMTVGAQYNHAVGSVFADVGESIIHWNPDNTRTLSYNLGMKRDLTRTIDTNLQFGEIFIDTDHHGRRTSFSSDIEFRGHWRSLSSQAGYSRTLNPTSGVGAVPPIAQIIYIQTTENFSQTFSSSLGADYALNKSVFGGSLDTRSYNLHADWTCQVKTWLSARLTLSHFIQSSNGAVIHGIHRSLITMSLLAAYF
jgi:hypothetical protein